MSFQPKTVKSCKPGINDITARRRTEEEVRESCEQLRALAARLQAAREEERIRISREIHNQLGEMLTGLKLGLGWMRSVLESDSAPTARVQLLENIAAIGSLADGTASRVRKLCTELRPSILDDLGLVAAIEWQTREFQTRTKIRCETRLCVEHVVANADQGTAMFRILQEILTNVARHAQASKVRVSLKYQAQNLSLEVKDNGRGIQSEQLAGRQSLGLLAMRERAAFLGGQFAISGRPGKGTTVTVRIPVPPTAEAAENPRT
jgi:signal transduction histidine kinase